MSAAISIRGLRVVRGGREVLHDIDLEVEAGAVTGLLGPSGSGKTTYAYDALSRAATDRTPLLVLASGST